MTTVPAGGPPSTIGLVHALERRVNQRPSADNWLGLLVLHQRRVGGRPVKIGVTVVLMAFATHPIGPTG